MRLSNTIGERIKRFDDLEMTKVQSFNLMFPECPLKDFDDLDDVEILHPTVNNCRVLLVNGKEVVHKMYSDLLYNVDKSEFRFRHDDEEPTDCLGFEMED